MFFGVFGPSDQQACPKNLSHATRPHFEVVNQQNSCSISGVPDSCWVIYEAKAGFRGGKDRQAPRAFPEPRPKRL